MAVKGQSIPHNQELTTTNQQFEGIKKAKSQFMGQLVHNLKNPIGSALSFSDMMIEDIDSYTPEKLKRYLNIVKASCEAALNQLDIVLIESKIEINELDLYLQQSKLSDIINDCIKANENSFKKNNFTIESSFLKDEKKINLDRKLIKYTIDSLFQFLLYHSGKSTHLKINLSEECEMFQLNIISNQCDQCEEKINEFIQDQARNNIPIFYLKPQKFFNFQAISYIAKKHKGDFLITKSESKCMQLTFTIHTELI